MLNRNHAPLLKLVDTAGNGLCAGTNLVRQLLPGQTHGKRPLNNTAVNLIARQLAEHVHQAFGTAPGQQAALVTGLTREVLDNPARAGKKSLGVRTNPLQVVLAWNRDKLAAGSCGERSQIKRTLANNFHLTKGNRSAILVNNVRATCGVVRCGAHGAAAQNVHVINTVQHVDKGLSGVKTNLPTVRKTISRNARSPFDDLLANVRIKTIKVG